MLLDMLDDCRDDCIMDCEADMTAVKTLERYRYIYDLMSRDVVVEEDGDLSAELGRLLGSKPLMKGTRRTYAAAIRYCLGSDDKVASFDRALNQAKPEVETKRPIRRQSVVIPEGLFESILEKLEDQKQSWSRALHLKSLIIGMRHFGLRPCEWEKAGWKDETRQVLVVRNAKFADGIIERGPFAGRVWKRGNGLSRELVLEEQFQPLLSRIADSAMMSSKECPYSDPMNARTYRRTHQWALDALRKERRFRADRLKLITIYSYRHAFSSDAKATVEISSGEVAALMGHISTNTAITSYAKKTARSGRVAITPSAKSVERVTVRNARTMPEFVREKTINRTGKNTGLKLGSSGIENKPRDTKSTGPNI